MFVTILTMGPILTEAAITDVSIQPEVPTIIDPVTVITSGLEGSGPVSIYDSTFQIDGAVLSLDLFTTVGHLDVMTPWSYSENIGFLPIGTYDLTVSTFEKFDPRFNYTFSTTFEVIPEPTSLLLFTTGIVGIHFLKRSA
jgi:hypothetical protein